MNTEEAKQLLAKVKRNQKLLADCPYHNFQAIKTSGPLVLKYRCTLCNGELEAYAVFWYEKGRTHERSKHMRGVPEPGCDVAYNPQRIPR